MKDIRDMRGPLTEFCQHGEDAKCGHCCNCERCRSARAGVKMLSPKFFLGFGEEDKAEVGKNFLAAYDTLSPEDKALFKERLGFGIDDLPDFTKLTVEQMRVVLLLFTGALSTAGSFNDAVNAQNNVGHPILRGAMAAKLFDEVVGHNVFLAIRDLYLMVVKLGIQNPGMFSWEDVTKGPIANVSTLGMMVASNVKDGEEMVQELMKSGIADSIEGIMEQAEHQTMSPFGTKTGRAEA